MRLFHEAKNKSRENLKEATGLDKGRNGMVH